MDAPLIRDAHAKVNLFLRVGRALQDGPHAGFHPVHTWMHAIDLRDTLTFERSVSSSLETIWESGEPAAWDPRDDLVHKAHAAIERAVGRDLPTHIRVTKRIPDGKGLGGGSSDAATTLLALRDLHKITLDDERLLACARELGADVSFFVDPGVSPDEPPRPAFASGIGHEIERTLRLNARFTLLLPECSCATKDVYAVFDTLNEDPWEDDITALRDTAAGGGFEIDPKRNSLTPAARRVTPELGAIIDRVSERTTVMMSGSGSALLAAHDAPILDGLDRVEVRPSRLV